MRSHLPVSLLILALAAPAGPALAAHCGLHSAPERVTGTPDAWRIHTRAGERVVRVPAPRATPLAAGGVEYVIQGLDVTFDSDGNEATIVDTLFVPIGSTVRFVMVAGIHTVTNGAHSGWPGMGEQFNYFLAAPGAIEGVPSEWDTTLAVPTVIDYFCQVHEAGNYRESMAGVIVVQDPAAVPPTVAARVGFSRDPAPNPSRGSVSFAVTLPQDSDAELSVHDVGGRRVATLHRGLLAAGEHGWQWNGRTDHGVRAAAGRYVIRLRAGAIEASRGVSLVR